MINTTLANGIIAESVKQNMNGKADKSDIRQLFEKVLNEKGVDLSGGYKWADDGSIEVNDLPASALHTFLLEAEKQGRKIGFERKTIIKFT